MDAEHLSRSRSAVIERAIEIEFLIDVVICQRYFGRLSQEFYLEVLYDEYFPFNLKRRILEKILGMFPRKQYEDLARIMRIRNIFAHVNIPTFEGEDLFTATARVLDPRNPDRNLDFDELYGEFVSKAAKIERRLLSIYRELGGEPHEQDGGLLVFRGEL